MDNETMRNWSTANHMKLNVGKTKVINFTMKMNMTAFEYQLCGSHINCMDTWNIS
jgi:hypothetical protein